MSEPSKSPAYSIFFPPDAEQIEYLAPDQPRYMLPRTPDRLHPVYVFVGSDMNQASVDRWADAVTEAYNKCTDSAVYILHDCRNPKIHFTAYFLTKARLLPALRPDLGGASALILRPQLAPFISLLGGLLKGLPSARPIRIFFDYDKALQWLVDLMNE